ncbi:MAG: hypothetical protein A2902_00005 [Elusimicrobia bacterium RIFCSPLOWO2_01_FULL_64_13]|nr:MAG: hypothetical protein A2636_00530 [Elusimicrobia bacterium RIFCSPHIGHO2_01_FULL_64_10]OGR97965.1 MAG: hypothetical protein A2902_00005 [Elusimicrobia bacterium RIFCSPLOWO2_01_FULL_64_13]
MELLATEVNVMAPGTAGRVAVDATRVVVLARVLAARVLTLYIVLGARFEKVRVMFPASRRPEELAEASKEPVVMETVVPAGLPFGARVTVIEVEKTPKLTTPGELAPCGTSVEMVTNPEAF